MSRHEFIHVGHDEDGQIRGRVLDDPHRAGARDKWMLRDFWRHLKNRWGY